MGQNYIGRTGDTYNFLTDEEQDIQKEINLTQVDTGAIVGDIAKIIFGINWFYGFELFYHDKFIFNKNIFYDRQIMSICILSM